MTRRAASCHISADSPSSVALLLDSARVCLWKSPIAFLIAFSMCCAGCGGGGGRVPVEGTVTLDGKAMPDIQVLFDQPELSPRENKGYSGRTDQDGRFVLRPVGEDGHWRSSRNVSRFAVDLRRSDRCGETPAGRKTNDDLLPRVSSAAARTSSARLSWRQTLVHSPRRRDRPGKLRTQEPVEGPPLLADTHAQRICRTPENRLELPVVLGLLGRSFSSLRRRSR